MVGSQALHDLQEAEGLPVNKVYSCGRDDGSTQSFLHPVEIQPGVPSGAAPGLNNLSVKRSVMTSIKGRHKCENFAMGVQHV